MHATRLRFARLAVLALVLAGCGGRSSDEATTPTAPGAATPQAVDPAAAAPVEPSPTPTPEPTAPLEPEPPHGAEPTPPPDVPPAASPPAPEAACEGERLARGECTCAFTRCFDQCCPEGWICIHPSRPGGASKCRRPPA